MTPKERRQLHSWRKCTDCGRFLSFAQIKLASVIFTPETEFTKEETIVTCQDCKGAQLELEIPDAHKQSVDDLLRTHERFMRDRDRRRKARVARAARSIEERFEDFHRANPSVYLGLVRLARQVHARGFETYAIDALFHVLRWETVVGNANPTREDPFKLNDHFTSRYARLIMDLNPDLRGFFRTRDLRTL